MPIPQSKRPRLGVLCLTVLSPLLFTQLSFAFRWTWLVPGSQQINFGGLQAGKKATRTEVLTNAGHHSVTVMSASLSGGGFALTTPTLPMTLSPGQSVTLSVVFSPAASKSYSATLAVVYSRVDHLVMNIPLAGTGTSAGTVSAVPASLSFGNVSVGSSATKAASLTSSGSSAVISSVTTTNAEFTVSGLTLPVTVPAGQSVPFTVKFSPQSSGAASGKLSFVTSGSGSVAGQTLSGSGSAAAPAASHAVGLSWQSGGSSVTGYNVYRGTISGGPYTKVNPSVDTRNSYSDTTVKGGQTYFYVVTSVDNGGNQSPYSSEVIAPVPTP